MYNNGEPSAQEGIVLEEDTQFHMTIVTRKRRRPPAAQETAPAENDPGTARLSGEDHLHDDGSHPHHHSDEHHHSGEHQGSGEHGSHRHYRDYGTVNLGNLPDSPAGAEPAAAAADREHFSASEEKPAQDLNQFAPIMNRHFRKRKNLRMFFILFLTVILLSVVATVILFLKNQQNTGEIRIETEEPLETVNLDDLID